MLWASIASGVAPAAHGITTPFEARPDGLGIQHAGARSWQSPPLWQTLAEAGVATAVIGCPGTAPAAHWPGCLVDEQFAEPLGVMREDWPLPPDCIAPRRLRAALRGLRVHPDELDEAMRDGLPPRPLALAASNHAAATAIAAREPWQLLVVHHGLLAHDQNDTAYAFVDAMLGNLRHLAGPGTDVIIVSPLGAIIAAGPSFAADTVLHGIVPADIAATVLARFGLRLEAAAGRPFLSAVGPLRPVTPAARAAPPPPSPKPNTTASKLVFRIEYEAGLGQAWSAIASGDHASAVPRLQAALARAPDDPNALFLLAQCRFFLGDAEPCLALGRRLCVLAPERPWGPLVVGAALMLLGKEAEAGPHLREAERLAGADAAIQVRLGAIRLHLGQAEAAETHYAAALAIDPDCVDARAGLGLARLAANDPAAAEAHLRAALALRHRAPALHHQLGALYAALGRWTEADKALRTALAQHPGLQGAQELLRLVEDQVLARLTPSSMMTPSALVVIGDRSPVIRSPITGHRSPPE